MIDRTTEMKAIRIVHILDDMRAKTTYQILLLLLGSVLFVYSVGSVVLGVVVTILSVFILMVMISNYTIERLYQIQSNISVDELKNALQYQLIPKGHTSICIQALLV